MHHVYILRNGQDRQYVGSTTNVAKRLEKHNHGEVMHTSKFKPWKLVHVSSFPTKELAIQFEKYLKSGSGTIFRYRHLAEKKG